MKVYGIISHYSEFTLYTTGTVSGNESDFKCCKQSEGSRRFHRFTWERRLLQPHAVLMWVQRVLVPRTALCFSEEFPYLFTNNGHINESSFIMRHKAEESYQLELKY
ncbi:hypothetical protein J6590_007473 [Homalodisca vitripennis]|nr:hypothetical protein J6590_007473 [Homalodisca vitripennis]